MTNLGDWGTVREAIDGLADQAPDSPFLIDPETGRVTTFAELRTMARSVAGTIARHGVSPGDTVAYAAHNGPNSAAAVLGILYGGYLATAINLVAGANTIAYVLDHSGARLIFVDANTAAEMSGLAANCATPPALIDIDDSLFDSRQGSTDLPAPHGASDGLLMYTSGTTGQPKGVVLTHKSLLSGGRNTATAHKLTDRDRALCVLPLYHINGLCVTVFGPLVSGGSVTIPGKFSTSRFWQTLHDHRCTWFSVVPTQISYLLHQDKSLEEGTAGGAQLRFGRSASAPLSPDVHEAFEARFSVPIIETMGLTETAAQILSNPLPPATRKTGSPGIAFGNEIIIADGAQCEVPRGTEGEVLVRGPNVMNRYLKNEAATASTITPDGWLRTGDLGRMDEDGYVFITGRLKELIIKGGENIAPREIDEALYSHPDVVEAAAFACDCSRYGQRVEAGVMTCAGSAVTETDLLDLCQSKLGAFKSPDRIHFLTELPKGPSGKIQRIKLAELVQTDR